MKRLLLITLIAAALVPFAGCDASDRRPPTPAAEREFNDELLLYWVIWQASTSL